ncbi:MAG: PDZ domain-containing protein, partial [Nitrospirae bacterium]|nr:PDZ domain-containing protein [Nitrospirota bacterium]
DYNLYRDIIQFARAKGIPIIALNIRKEIIDKVSKKGIDSLTEEEKKALPDGINMKDRAYREYLKRVFSRHGSRKGRSFDNFYYSQLLWDETMASTIVSALKNHPDAQMVVIAGNGHVRNAWGVPGRIERRGIKDYTILLTASQGGQTPFDKGVADYVFYTEWMDPPESVRLGVFLQKTDDGIKIERVAKGGPASKAGVPEGVYIVEIDGIPVIDIEDIKIALIDKVQGDRIKLKIKRRVLLFEKEEEVEVEL